MGPFTSLLEREYSKSVETIVLVGGSSVQQTGIINEMGRVFMEKVTDEEIHAGVEKFGDAGDDDLTVRPGLINYYYFPGLQVSLNVYGIIPISRSALFSITENSYHLVLVIDLKASLDFLQDRSTEEGMMELIQNWRQELSQVQSASSPGRLASSLSVMVLGCDAIQYNFKSMQKIDLMQQVLRLICINENKQLNAQQACVCYLKNWGDDAERLLQFLELVVEGKSDKIVIDDYDSIFIPVKEDSVGKIKIVNEAFDDEKWSKTEQFCTKHEEGVVDKISTTTEKSSVSVMEEYQKLLRSEFQSVRDLI
ncbi:hypothetical protein FOA43_001746 [Brettanomyces nanus]|uniref:Uncharacterized protein n=1 Tax=Eeniella nana TaxID=13502 RepID=A0A875RUC5_EENNA|nr:uncharacterized protein FOA43_001746 [Brettanomyces nanus]QPG74417.1 hypothetical protein FOA43_001746 [Brettanomyces nanus]